MNQPEGFDDGSGRVCKLQKSFYGLKQASRCWNEKFTSFLKKFNQSKADPCLFIGAINKTKLLLAICVDDGFVACKDSSEPVKF